MPARPHLEACRKRMYEELGKTEKGKKRMGKTEEKIDEYMETQHRRENEGDSAQAQEGIAGDPNADDEDRIVIDEEDNLTLEEHQWIWFVLRQNER